MKDQTAIANAPVGTVSSSLERPIGLLALLAALALFALAAAFHPLDAAALVTGDPLYVIHMLEYGLLEYRPPLSNRWVPDALLHLVISPAGLDPARQAIAVGIVIFLVTSVAIHLWKGPAAFALYLLVLATAGFGFINSINHFSLPLAVLAYLLARGRPIEPAVLFVVVFNNPLILFPLTIVLVGRDAPRAQLVRAAVSIVALAANTVYTEFSTALAMLAVAFPAWFIVAWLAVRLGLRTWYCIALIVALPAAAAFGVVPERYGVPVAACLPLFLFPLRSPRMGWLSVAAPAAVVAMFLASVQWGRHDQLAADYDCLLDEIDERGIGMVATDHWNAKPLHFAAKAKNRDIGIVQVRFDDGTVHSLLAPYDFYGAPTRWAVRGIDSCEVSAYWSPIFCGQPDIAPVASSESLCRNFELYEYAVELPLRPETRPAGKLSAAWRNLEAYVGQVRRLAGI